LKADDPNLFATAYNDLKTKAVKKGTVLLSPGEHARYAYRVTKGCLRSYVTDATGKEHILQFAPEGWYISDMSSLVNNAKASVTIDAIEDSEFLVFDKTVLKSAEEIPYDILIQLTKTLQNNIIATNKRLIHLLSSTAEERYLDFLETYPGLAKRLPLKLIAAYLGISPEFVSRIRKKIVHK
jgi:CRP-like cAMP-binding protein